MLIDALLIILFLVVAAVIAVAAIVSTGGDSITKDSSSMTARPLPPRRKNLDRRIRRWLPSREGWTSTTPRRRTLPCHYWL
jgi:hypothetical protein